MTPKEYNQCVDLYADRVYRFILKNIKDPNDANDIVQNAFEILWKKHKEVNVEKARQYLFTTAYHNMIDWIRKHKRIENHAEIEESAAVVETEYTGLKEILAKALELLPEVQRTVVLLRDYEGYSYKEIANITSLNESQVKVYIYRARTFLKNHIGNIAYVL